MSGIAGPHCQPLSQPLAFLISGNTMDWKEYEIYITRHFQRLFPEASITHDVHRYGLISKTKRQIDILIEQELAGFNLSIIIDCKYFSKKINIKHVETFLSFLLDLKVSKGIMITNHGYSKAAYNRANYDTQDVELQIMNFEDLEKYQGFIGIPFSGSHCAVVSAPDGWILDNNPKGPYLASLYPAGLSQEEAFHTEGFIYLSFSNKDANWPDLMHLLNVQEDRIKSHYKNPRYEYIDTIKRKDCNILLRALEADEVSGTREYSLFLDFPGVILFLNLLAPISKAKSYLKKLEWVGEKLIKGNVIVDRSDEPISFPTDKR